MELTPLQPDELRLFLLGAGEPKTDNSGHLNAEHAVGLFKLSQTLAAALRTAQDNTVIHRLLSGNSLWIIESLTTAMHHCATAEKVVVNPELAYNGIGSYGVVYHCFNEKDSGKTIMIALPAGMINEVLQSWSDAGQPENITTVTTSACTMIEVIVNAHTKGVVSIKAL